MRGAEQRLKSEADFQKWLAWHIALLPHSKKIPSFRDFMGPDKKSESRRQTPEQMMSSARAWHQQINKGKH